MFKKMTIVAAAALSALATAAAASAGTSANVTATATVTGAAALSLSSSATPSLTNLLDGSDQTATYTFPLAITDARGNGAGWNTTITSTTFTSGSSSLATSASSISLVSSSCVSGGTCTAPTNSVGYPLTVPAAGTAPAAVKFFDAAANTGMGRFTLTPTVSVAIPGNSFAGSYSSTVTVAVVSGP
jgi:hypothetical protein